MRRQGKLARLTPEDRFLAAVVMSGQECWAWTGQRDAKGYGLMADGTGGKVRAHRWVWETMVGPIPEGYTIDHLCRNPSCVNPDHLEPVDNAENQRRRWDVVHRCRDCGSTDIEIQSAEWAR